jgi:hypothetical protein
MLGEENVLLRSLTASLIYILLSRAAFTRIAYFSITLKY